MALDFEVNFEKAIRGVQDFHAQMLRLGSVMDGMETKGGKFLSPYTGAFQRVHQETDKLAAGLKGLGAQNGELAKAAGTAEAAMTRALAGMANGYFTATVKADAFATKNSELKKTLSETANLQAYVKWQQKIATLYTEAAGEAEYLKARLKFLNSEEGKALSVLKAKAAAAEKANRADADRQARADALKRELIALNSVLGQQIARDEVALKTKRALITFSERQAGATKLLRKEIAFLGTEEGKTQARLAEQKKSRQQLAGFLEKQAGATKLLRKEIAFLGSEEGQTQARLIEQKKSRQQLAGFLEKQAGVTKLLRKEIAFLGSEEGRTQARLIEQKKSRQQLAGFLEKQAGFTKLLRKEVEFLGSEEGRTQARLAEQKKSRQALNGFLEKQAGITKLLRKEVEFLGTEEGKQQIRLAEQKKSRQEMAGYLEKQRGKLAQLRAEAEFLASVEGQALVRQEAQNRASREAIGYLEKQRAKLEQLRAEAEFLASAEGRALLQQELANKASRHAATFLERQRIKTAELTAELEFLTSAEGRAQVAIEGQVRAQRKQNQALAEGASLADAHVRAREAAIAANGRYLSIANQVIRADREMAVTGERLAFGYERLSQAQASLAAQQARARLSIESANQALIEGEQNLHRYTAANLKAEQASRRLADEEARSARRRQATLDELKRAILERDRADKAYQATAQRVAEATRRIGAAEARTRAERERAVAGAQAYNAALVREAQAASDAEVAGKKYWLQLRRLNEAMLTSSAERLNQQFVHLAASGRQATGSLHALTSAEAALTASEERANRLLELRNRLTLEQARANERRSTTEATLTRAMERQIEAESRRNKLARMTTAELLGVSTANAKAAKGFRASEQAAAMFRAGITGLHASIGIYTGATVLAASATFAIAAALRGTVTAGMEFTETMSRAEAVMMTSSSALTEAGRSMESAGMMVRALGASTLFTATEVSGGLVDLGMAGLSASQAMTALAPSLNLAAIGAIDMSQAADIATNVMTAFNLKATDLTDVVDVMATAVTSSNTNIQQLAQALSYVGPAANAAGFSLRDTVATIEVLTNAGIKGSKAGTGLRRFMLNIQNPTAKAAAVMDRYNISIVDAEGQTRSMTEILGQFHKALVNDAVTPAERTAAVMDLVGVRAHSAVSRMIGAFGEFGALRRQLDSVTGAAEQMRQTMEENLTADWKQLKSAFQDVQIEVFDAYDEHLRELAARWTKTLAEMESKVGTISLGVDAQGTEQFLDYTGVDVFIAKLDRIKDTLFELKPALQGFLAIKGAVFLRAGAENAQQMAQNMAELSTRFQTNRQATAQYSLALGGLTARFKTHVLNVSRSIGVYGAAARALNGLGLAGHYAARGMAILATGAMYATRALSVVASAFGWVGLVWGVYAAVSTLFSKDTEARIKEHGEEVSEATKRYEKLQAAIEATREARMEAALLERRKEARSELNETNLIIDKLQVALEYIVDEDSRQRLEDQLLMQQRRAKELETQITDTTEALGRIGINQAQHQQLEGQLRGMAALYADNKKAIEDLQQEQARLNSTSRDSGVQTRALGQELIQLTDITEGLEGVMALLGHRVEETRSKFVDFGEMAREAMEAQRATLQVDYDIENMSDQERYNYLLMERTRLQDKLDIMAMSSMADANHARDTQAQLLEVDKEIVQLENKRNEAISEGLELSRERERLQANEEPTLAAVVARLKEIAQEKEKIYAPSMATGERLSFDDVERLNSLREEENRLLGERNQLLEAANKPSRSPRRSREDNSRAREFEREQQAIQALLDEMYPLRAEQRQYREELALLSEEYARLISVSAQAAASHGVMSTEYLNAQTRMMTLREAMSEYSTWRENQALEEQREAFKGLMDDLYPDIARQREYTANVKLLTETHQRLVVAAREAAESHGEFSDEARAARAAVFDLDDALGKLRDGLEEKTDMMDEFAKNAAKGMQQHFADFLFDPFAEGLDGMLANFQTLIQRLVAEAVAADLTRRLFGAAAEGGSGDGWLGTAMNWGIKALGMASGGGAASYAGGSDWASAVATSFDGGGFTGWGARAGGIDGKGGFMAMLHPQETVVDHTQGDAGGTRQSITNNFILEERKDRRTQSQLAMKAAQGQRRANARFGA